MAEIIGVTFKDGGKLYYFAPNGEKYEKGTGVIVETARGVEYATVVTPCTDMPDESITAPLKPVLRAATPKDEETHRKNLEKRAGAFDTVREKIEKFNLDMKLIDCEFAFDGSKAIFYYSSPQRVDFRELVKELSSTFHMRIELRQIGIRDEIKLMGGIAPCGRECCCSSCMPNLKKVSIKMAKNQGLSLNPQKISGLCGRLMCCLEYENDYYAEACKRMPKIGSEAGTPDGKGTVVNIDMLKMTVRVRIEDRQKDTVAFRDYPVDEIKFRRAGRPEEDDEEEKAAESEPQEERKKPFDKGESSDGRQRRDEGRQRHGKPPRGDRPKGDGQNKERAQDGENGENTRPPRENNGGRNGKSRPHRKNREKNMP